MKAMTLLEAHKMFRETFKMPLNSFLDPMLTAMLRQPVIDIFKFDTWLHKEHGNYEEQGKSMEDILTEKYGKRTVRFVAALGGFSALEKGEKKHGHT